MLELSAFFPLHALTKYITALTVIGFGAMLWDKLSAMAGINRLSERSLVIVAALGGFLGVITGGLFFHHKTSKAEFWGPIALATVLWVVFLIIYFNPRIVSL